MAREERRLAAIVLADVVGYSRHMGEDESGTLAALKSVRADIVDPKITEHAGRLVKTMGDGLLLEFGSVVNAVRCAVDIQRAIAQRNSGVPMERALQFRVGVNVGDIIIDGGDIFGDGINIAARLQALADPGGICVSKAVHDQVRGKLDVTFDALGPQRVKNIAEPVDVYRVMLDGAAAHTPVSRRTAARSFAWRGKVGWLGGGLLGLGAAAVSVWIYMRPFESAPGNVPPALSVAIAPFAAPHGDVDAAQLATSLARRVTIGLPRGSQSGRVRVMAVGAREGNDGRRPAGYRYLLEGDVGREADRVDVHLRLVDAASGDQVWSTRQALKGDDLAKEFSPKVHLLIDQLRSAVRIAEIRRVSGQSLSRLSAPELVLRADAVYEKDHSLAGAREARRIVDEAIRIDPDYAPAWITKTMLINVEGDVDPNQDRDRIGREQDEFTARAVALDSTDTSAWLWRATALAYLARWEGALEAVGKAIRQEPFEMDHRLIQAWLVGLMGRPDETLVLVDEALRIDPESLATATRTACEAHVLAGHATPAVTACEKSSVLFADWMTKVYLVAAYANNGDTAKAAAAKDDLLRIVPGYTIAQLRAKRYSDHPDYLVLAEKNWYSGLRKAGIPER